MGNVMLTKFSSQMMWNNFLPSNKWIPLIFNDGDYATSFTTEDLIKFFNKQSIFHLKYIGENHGV